MTCRELSSLVDSLARLMAWFARGQPDRLRCVRKLPLAWPDPSQPGVGQPVAVVSPPEPPARAPAAAAQSIKLIELVSQSINKTDKPPPNASALNSLSEVGRRLTSSSGARFTKYLMTILRLSYDNAKVTIDLP